MPVSFTVVFVNLLLVLLVGVRVSVLGSFCCCCMVSIGLLVVVFNLLDSGRERRQGI